MISLVGSGIKGFSQITLEGLAALRRARRVLTFYAQDPFFAEQGLSQVESLAELYLDGARDEENYERLLARVEEAALEFGEVAVLLPGHPRVGVTIAQRLGSRAGVEVIPGVSSFDTLINDLAVDPLEKGSVVLDVNRLLLFDLPLVPELDYYLYHVCSVGTARTHYSDPARDNALSRLSAKLRAAFPEDHRVTLIGSSTAEGSAALRFEVPLKDLERLLPEIKFETSLFVPGLRPKRYDEKFLELLLSPGKAC